MYLSVLDNFDRLSGLTVNRTALCGDLQRTKPKRQRRNVNTHLWNVNVRLFKQRYTIKPHSTIIIGLLGISQLYYLSLFVLFVVSKWFFTFLHYVFVTIFTLTLRKVGNNFITKNCLQSWLQSYEIEPLFIHTFVQYIKLHTIFITVGSWKQVWAQISTHVLFVRNLLINQKFSRIKNSHDPKIFMNQKFSWTKNFHESKIFKLNSFINQKLSWTKIFHESKIFTNQIFSRTKMFH